MTDEAAVDVILDLLDRMYFTATTDTAATVANDSSSEEAPVSKRRRTIPEPVAYLVTRWSEDPFSLGAYTTGEESSTNADRLAYAVGLTDLDAPDDAPGVEDDYKRAKSKIPRLLFAGEGTLTGNEAKVSHVGFSENCASFPNNRGMVIQFVTFDKGMAIIAL